MKILSIETSCDETGAAVVERDVNGIKVISNTVATSSEIHAKTGGIIPEKAAREQLTYIIPVITKALLASEGIDTSKKTKDKYNLALDILKNKIDAIAVTNGPGLIGSLLVGVETAKTLSFSLNKPLIPVHHLLSHISANFIDNHIEKIEFPLIGLIISGGHTDLLLYTKVNDFLWLGGTRDDAAGEALDKIGRLLKINYPAGREIENRAKKINNSKISFKSPLLGSSSYDFSFSGLKAEVARYVDGKNLNEEDIDEICYATQKAIIQVVVEKTIKAAINHSAKSILIGGGVSANQTLKEKINIEAKNIGVRVYSPKIEYCTDNAAMIGAQSLIDFDPKDWREVRAQPELYFERKNIII